MLIPMVLAHRERAWTMAAVCTTPEKTRPAPALRRQAHAGRPTTPTRRCLLPASVRNSDH
jgi:hypothetical protein